jgi:hypothetical protein
MGVYDRENKTVTCVECLAPQTQAVNVALDLENASSLAVPLVEGPEQGTEPFEVSTGTAGASAKREYERRKDRRETRIRDGHPHLGA